MSEFDQVQAAHLLRRAGFGGNQEDVQYLVLLGREGAVDYLLNYEQVSDSAMEQALAAQDYLRQQPLNLLGIWQWWLFRLLNTRRPLQEKMSLFWHDHFATAISKVTIAELMLQQNQLFRSLALGNFREMLLQVSKDPAMIIWLDNNTNIKDSPNENYARELMELFTMGIHDVIAGEPNYTEQDIHESARAFTGWTIRRGRFFFNASQHDDGTKTFLGETGNFDGGDIVDILVKHPATARFMSKKLLEFFVYPNPEPELIQQVADIYLESQYDIKSVVRHILLMDTFYSEKALLANIKSPTELVVGTIRMLRATATPHRTILGAMSLMEQMLFNPPTVAGWDGGLNWINTATLLVRYNLANGLTSARGGPVATFDPNRLLQGQNLTTAEDVVDYCLKIFGPLPVSQETRQALIDYLNSAGTFTLSPQIIDRQVRGLIHLIMTLPEYQLN